MICEICGSTMIWQNDFEHEGSRNGVSSLYSCESCGHNEMVDSIFIGKDTVRVNKIQNVDCLEGIEKLPEGCIDMILTSPPYDNLRSYKGYSFEFESIAKELYRVLKKGGVMIWIVGDATIKGSETGTSFKQALFFKECGFNLHDTMIYRKKNPTPQKSNRYQPSFEYMFVLSKGKPSTFNPIMTEKKYMENRANKQYNKKKDGKQIVRGYKAASNMKVIANVWDYSVGLNNSTSDKIAFSHPAIFPEKLAEDHIISWSNEGDIVLDPFMGSGTTAKMAALHNRYFIGFEISHEYCEIATKRIENL